MQYDIIIIGGGAAGLVSAKLAVGLGKRVALFEKEKIGGDCTLTGCIPSKSLINIANTFYLAQNLKQYTVKPSIDELDTKKVMQHARDLVDEVYAGHTPEKLRALGIDVILGTTSFVDAHTVECNGTKYTAQSFIITAGGRPFVPPIDGLANIGYLTNRTFFDLKQLPSSLLILGGGPIGIEIGSCVARLGKKVTLIERNQTLLPREDAEIVSLVTETIREQGVQFHTNMTAVKAYKANGMIAIECADANNVLKSFSAEQILIATGKQPNTDSLNLKAAGVKAHQRGIIVTDTLQTTAPHIYACGDIVGPYLFSHMAEYQATIATRNALIPFFKKKVDYTQAVWVTYTFPELASAGLTETAAREKYGDSIQIFRSSYKNYDRPLTDGRRTGMAKVICDKKGLILGTHIFGARAGELISETQLLKYFKKPFRSLYHVIHPYPTYSDVLWQSAKKAYITHLRNNWFLQILQKIRAYFK